MKNKRPLRLLAVVFALVLSVTTFSTVAYAGGGDYHDSELPPAENTEPEETTPPEEETEPVTITPGTPFTEDGIAATRDLLYDKHTNKQYITIETRNGNTFYIVIDYDKQLDEEEERYQTYFLNPVDEADLLALLEDEDGNTPIVCSCADKCVAGAVNTDCQLCSTDMTNCAGKEAEPVEPEEPEQPEEPEESNMGGILAIVLILALGGGAAVWYFKFRKPKESTKGSTELDEFDFDDDEDEEESYGDDGYELDDPEDKEDTEE